MENITTYAKDVMNSVISHAGPEAVFLFQGPSDTEDPIEFISSRIAAGDISFVTTKSAGTFIYLHAPHAADFYSKFFAQLTHRGVKDEDISQYAPRDILPSLDVFAQRKAAELGIAV